MTGELEAVLIGLIDETIELSQVPAAFARLLACEASGLKTVISVAPKGRAA